MAAMEDIIDHYDEVTLEAFYELVGKPELIRHTDCKYGWRDLSMAYSDATRDGYILRLPRMKPLDRRFMNNKPDNNGRYSLSGREYYALRELFAAVDGFNRNACELEKRVRTIPNGYRDLRMLQSVSAKLMRDILETVPVKKLAQIRRELSSSEMILRVSL